MRFHHFTAIETLNESELDGRFIIVREDREETKFRNSVACKVAGLPADTTWQRVKDEFRDAGDVRSWQGGHATRTGAHSCACLKFIALSFSFRLVRIKLC